MGNQWAIPLLLYKLIYIYIYILESSGHLSGGPDLFINAFDAINLATELQIDIVLTDHHEIKASPPSVLALLHPSTTPKASPYRELAGVGLAYILASTLANEFKSVDALRDSLDLFCIGEVDKPGVCFSTINP